MYEAKQNQTTQSSIKSQAVEETPIGKDSFSLKGTQVQQFLAGGQIPNPKIQAQMLGRIPTKQMAANPQLLLQMQQQYGNRYVNQVVQQARQQSRSSSQPLLIQPKLTIGDVGDRS